MQNVLLQKQIQLKSFVMLATHSCLTFMNTKDTLINTSRPLHLILLPAPPHQAAALLIYAVGLTIHPTDEITPQGGAMKDMQWAAREHQPPWMNPCHKPAPRFEVISSMTQIFLHA